MADENVGQTDENSQSASAASSSAEGQGNEGNTPAGEQSASKAPENRVPQSRFNEVVHEKNREREMREMYERRIQELESRPSVGVPQRETVIDAQVKRLVSELKMDESAARVIVESQAAILQDERNKQNASQSRTRAEQWAQNKALNDPDYKVIEPELDKAFSQKSLQMQHAIASNEEMLEMFYESVRSKHLGAKAKDAFARGTDEAYKAKQIKQAISSMPGNATGSGSQALSREWIRRSTPEEYAKRLPEINEALRKGLLK